MSWSGHYWTIVPHLVRRGRSFDARRVKPWSCSVPDGRGGTVRLHGRLHAAPGRGGLLIVVHGLGGSSESGYARAAAEQAEAAGLDCLRLNLRGAGGCGEDFYHAGLWQDLDHVVHDPQWSGYDSLYLLGYSLGGHVCLSWAANAKSREDCRVRALAAVCPPLDLSGCVTWLDAPRNSLYRRHVLGGVKQTYRAVAARRPVPLPVAQAERITRIRDWDHQVVAPRHGFASASHYYDEASVGPRLAGISLPTLMLVALRDPMVPHWTLEPALTGCSESIVVKRTERGGHVGFPADLELGLPGAPGLERQLLGWLQSQEQGR